MGIINFFRRTKEILNTLKQKGTYIQMNTEELAVLDNNELLEAVNVRIDSKVWNMKTMEKGLVVLNEYEKAFFSSYNLEMEVNNGGLCQFFVNSSSATAPYVSDGLALIGAEEHKELFNNFVTNNNIDVTDLSSFVIDNVEEFEQQTMRYPFDEYDDAFYQMEPIESYLLPFVRDNLAML